MDFLDVVFDFVKITLGRDCFGLGLLIWYYADFLYDVYVSWLFAMIVVCFDLLLVCFNFYLLVVCCCYYFLVILRVLFGFGFSWFCVIMFVIVLRCFTFVCCFGFEVRRFDLFILFVVCIVGVDYYFVLLCRLFLFCFCYFSWITVVLLRFCGLCYCCNCCLL